MSQIKKILLHIGKHKTGSTSFQHMLRVREEDLERLGICVLPSSLCIQIAATVIRDNLPIPSRTITLKQNGTLDIESITQEISQFLTNKTADTLIISSEDYSYFRTATEVRNLRKVLPKDCEYSVFFVTRESEDFRISYLKEVAKTGLGPINHKSSPYYCGKDSWLLDDDKIIDLWRHEFGNITVLDYSRDGMVEKLGRAMQLPKTFLKEEYRLNETPVKGTYLHIMMWVKIALRKTKFYNVCASLWKIKKSIWVKNK